MMFYNRIKNEVTELKNKYSRFYPNDGTAFGHFIIKEIFSRIMYLGYDGNNLDDYIRDHIVDMKFDSGNDAIFVIDNEIFIFQFKYSNNPLLNFNEIKKNKKFIDFILGNCDEELPMNSRLEKIYNEEIKPILTKKNIEDKNYHIIFYYIDNNFNNESIKIDIKSLFINYKDKGIPFQIKIYDYSELEFLYDDVEIPKNNVKLKISDKYFEKPLTYFDLRKDILIRTLVLNINANSLKSLIEEKKESLLALNVRYYKGENDINLKIKEEYTKGERSNFWILNNGINAVCEFYKINENDNEIEIKNFQIVNGGQTTKTLTRVLNDLPDTLEILMRLTEIKDIGMFSTISKSIAIASNSQNAISERDLHSGDPIQKRIFKKFDSVGIFYDKREGEWATVIKKNYKNPEKGTPTHLKIINMDMGKSYLSFFMQLPISSKGREKLIFSDYYDEIFNKYKDFQDQFNRLIFSYGLSEKIKELKDDFEANYEILENSFINDVLLSLSSLFFIQDNLKLLKNCPDNVTNRIKELLADKEFKDYINAENKYKLNCDDRLKNFMKKIFSILDDYLEIKKETHNNSNPDNHWTPRDTNNWLKKDGTYSEITKRIVKKLEL